MWAEAIGAAALAITVPGSAYLAALSAAAALPLRRQPPPGATATAAAAAPRIVILVPAHNESTGLLRTLDSLRAAVAGDALATVVVVADNCDDNTAALARAAGVQVLERRDPLLRGKGHALQFGFDAITDADWFIVIDADTDVGPGFLAAMRRAMVDGQHGSPSDNQHADALQCRYLVRDPLASRRATLADVALGAWNLLRPRGRAALGLSAGILGNGFALSRRTLTAVPYTARSIVEDVEYHQLLLRAGLRVGWVDGAEVRGDMPTAAPAAALQRARWEGGRLRLLADQGPRLLADLLRGRWALADPLLDLLLLPLAWHVALLTLALALGAAPVQLAAALGLGGVALHVALALWLMRAGATHLTALLGVPAYVLWKLWLAGATWRAAGRQARWVRSARGTP